MNLNDLQTFCLVADTGTVSAAAKRLGVPKSTVSRRVRRLEDALGHELLRRSARAVTLTEHGRALHQRSAASLRELAAAAEALQGEDKEPNGALRVTTVPGFGQSHAFVECIRSYGLQYPRTTIHLELTTRLVNLVEEGFDVGIRLHTGTLTASPLLMCRRLLRFTRGVYASPAYLQEMGTPTSLADLPNHRIAAHALADLPGFQWNHNGRPTGAPATLPNPRFIMNDSAALERFALAGAGLALLSTIDGELMTKQEQLVRVLPDYEHQGATASLIWPASRHLAPRVRAFIAHAVQTMG